MVYYFNIKMQSKGIKYCACIFTSMLIFSKGSCNKIEFCEEVASVSENFPKISHTLKEITDMCLRKLNDETEAKKYSVSKPFEFQYIGKMMDDVIKTLNRQTSSTAIRKTKAPDKHEVHHEIKNTKDETYKTALSSTDKLTTVPQYNATTVILKNDIDKVTTESLISETNTEYTDEYEDKITLSTPIEDTNLIPDPEIAIPIENFDNEAKFDSNETLSKNIVSTSMVYEEFSIKQRDEIINKGQTTPDTNSRYPEKVFTTTEFGDNYEMEANAKANESNLHNNTSQQYAYNPLFRYNETKVDHKGRNLATTQTGLPEEMALTTAGMNSKLLWCLVFLAAVLIAFTVPVLYKRIRKRSRDSHDLEVQYTS